MVSFSLGKSLEELPDRLHSWDNLLNEYNKARGPLEEMPDTITKALLIRRVP